MKSFALLTALGLIGLTCVAGCGKSPESTAALITPTATPKIDSSLFLLHEEPTGAVGVMAARESAEDGKPLVLVGRIGGTANPWIEGRAAFTLLDASMSVVAEGEDSEENELCMGDCCATERLDCTTLVKIVDHRGSAPRCVLAGCDLHHQCSWLLQSCWLNVHEQLYASQSSAFSA